MIHENRYLEQVCYSVLVIEDNYPDAQFIEELLPTAGYSVQQASSLKQAIEICEKRKPDVVLLDLYLPDSQGLQTFLSVVGATDNVPIIILTGMDDETVAIQALKLGAQDYFLKRELNENLLPRAIRYAIERKRTQEALRHSLRSARESESQAREAVNNLQLALRSSQTGVWSLDVPSRTVTCDERILKMHGLETTSLKQSEKIFLNTIHEQDRERVTESMLEAVRSGNGYEEEFRVLFQDGSVHYLSASGKVVLNALGEPVRMDGVCRDITRQKQQEEKEKRLLVLEQHEDFIATLTHDLKNPLLGTERILDLFIEGKIGPLTDEQKRVVKIVQQANSNVLELIKNMLEVYRYEEGLPPLDLVERDVSLVASTCLQQFETLAAHKNVELIVSFNDDDNKLLVDETALRRVIMNLIGNALKFTPAGGKVTLVGRRELEHYVFEVTDSGAGIPEKDLGLLFQRFFQGRIGKLYGVGTGIGLYLCRQLVEAHGGIIECLNTEGQGATFKVSLPSTIRSGIQPVDRTL